MSDNFKTIAAEQGWTPSTQVTLLLEFIENNVTGTVLDEYLSQKVTKKDEPRRLGLDDALEDMRGNKALKLYKCVVGVYPTTESEFPIFEYPVFVSEKNEDDALAEGLYLCEKTYGADHPKMSFANIDDPTVIECLDDIDD